MSSNGQPRLAAIVITLLFLAPAIPTSPASGGSSWSGIGPDLKNGTLDGSVWTASGIRLPYNETYLDNWTRMDPWPTGRMGHSMAYDSINKVMVVFGGQNLGGNLSNETFLYYPAENVWKQVYPGTSPCPRANHALVFDSANGEFVLYGGSGTLGLMDDTWTYNATTNIWKEKRPTSWPPWREGVAAGYDPATGQVIMFGGNQGSDRTNETWGYNLTTNKWARKYPSNAPSIRYGSGFIYDPTSGLFLLFGGSDCYGYFCDTWVYNGTADSWTEMSPATNPPAIFYQGLSFDTLNKRTIMYGGFNETGSQANRTWAYDMARNTWTEKFPLTDPMKRFNFDMEYDPQSGEAIFFGGNEQTGNCDDTWSYNLSSNRWTKRNAAPEPRMGARLAYDASYGLSILFGGYGHFTNFNDIWTYDLQANKWSKRQPVDAPEPDGNPRTVLDTANEVLLYYGGSQASIWAYDIQNSTWTNMHPNAPTPGLIGGFGFAFDSRRGEAVLHGGGGGNWVNGTWSYNYTNNKWTDLNTPDPPQFRAGAEMVYDSIHDVMVLFGGSGVGGVTYNDTWIFNRTRNTWTNVTPAASPPGRHTFQMARDPSSGRILMYGGWDMTDMWSYDVGTNTWKRLRDFRGPLERAGAGVVFTYDGTLISFGGYSGNPMSGDTWVYDLKRYVSSGTYASAPLDAGGSAYFGALELSSKIPANTSLKLQLRSGPDNATMQARAFTGPDGTNSSFYNASGERISSSHNGSRWVQYKVFLETKDPAFSPLFKGATIKYNLLHTATLLTPAGVENWTDVQQISWTASDPDNDSLSVDIDLLGPAGENRLATGLPAGDSSWAWDTSSTENGTYRIRLTVRDDNLTIPLSINVTSPEFVIFHPHINEAPSAELVYPENGALITTDVVNLTWTGSDPENDTLDYTVYVLGEPFDVYTLPAEGNVTYDSYYELTGLADLTTYWWTVVPCDGQIPGEAPEVRNFTIDLPHAPAVELLSPEDGARLNTTSVELRWHGSDADRDKLIYLVYFNATPFDASSLPTLTLNTTADSHIATGLSNGTAYYWTVVACDPLLRGAAAPVRGFTVDISIGNRLPRFTSTAPVNVTVGEPYEYNLTAVDEDGDSFSFSKVAGPAGLSVNDSTQKVEWTPNGTGNFTVTVRVMDRKGGYSDQTFTIEVKAKPPVIHKPPTLTVTTTINNTKVRKTITIIGKAAVGSLPVTLVQYKVDDGQWQAATGTENWSFTLDTTSLRDGKHTISVRAYDGTSHSAETLLNVDVSNAGATPVEAGFPMWLLAVVAVVIVAAAGAAAMLARRNKPAAPAEEASSAPAAVLEDARPEPEAAPPAPEKEPLAPDAEEIAIKAGEKASPAVETAAPAPVASEVLAVPPPAVAKKTAPEGFAVEDIFLMYIDGRLIQHNTRRIKADMDADIMASMLTAVQAFIKESVGMEKGTELGAMEYGENKILLQKGKHVVLAVVIEGSEPPEFRDEIRHTISNIESEFGPVLASWDGMATKLSGAKKFLGRLGDYAPAQRPAAQAPAAKDVSVKAELEFYQGFVRLKVAVKNDMPTLIARASFRLVYDEEALRLDRIEPSLECKGNEVQLGIVEPNVKKTIAFYLDPQICTESYLEGILAYKDAHGNLKSVQLPRKLASVVCPIVYTDENINTAMLKRMAAEELDKKDTKVFAIPPALAPELAFDLAEAAVQHHDVKLVREFTEKAPFVGEAWYYGKAKGREDKLVVRARVLGDKRVLEFFVASGSTLMLTGMLAELKADLNRELAGQRGAPEMRQVTAPAEVDAVANVRTLLDKAAELEQAAGETDQGR